MGRPSTGAYTVYESLRIELSYLNRIGLFKKGCIRGVQKGLTWYDSNGYKSASIGICASYCVNNDCPYIEVEYKLTNACSVINKYKYRIYLVEKESNLGKGKILYFICPETGKNCRILYLAYGSSIFKCRDAYSERIYYDCQLSSKRERPMNCFYLLEDHIEKLKNRNSGYRRQYQGRPTRAATRYNRLKMEAAKKDQLRWEVLNKWFKSTSIPKN